MRYLIETFKQLLKEIAYAIAGSTCVSTQKTGVEAERDVDSQVVEV